MKKTSLKVTLKYRNDHMFFFKGRKHVRFVLKYKFPLGELEKYKTKGEKSESNWLNKATERKK